VQGGRPPFPAWKHLISRQELSTSLAGNHPFPVRKSIIPLLEITRFLTGHRSSLYLILWVFLIPQGNQLVRPLAQIGVVTDLACRP
jgi:hypothetical protein